MKNLFVLLFAAVALSSFTLISLGGHVLKFDSPGEGFEKSEDGNSYENLEDNAILKGILMSKKYIHMKNEVDNAISNMSDLEVLSSGDEKLGWNNGYLLKLKKIIDDENAIIQYMFIFPAGHGMTGNMTATFPESLMEKYSDAMLKAMGTARMVHNH